VREARSGDRYLLCTDGLTGPVGSRDTLHEALSIEDPQAAVDRLVELALRGGGPDNITVIVADVVETGSGPQPPVVGGAAAEKPQDPPPGAGESAAGPGPRGPAPRRAEHRPAPPPAGDVVVGARQGPPPQGEAGAGRPARAGRARLGAFAGWSYLRSQYFVGVDGEQVAVFRGVNTSVAGVSLASLEERTDLAVERLDPIARPKVERAGSPGDGARRSRTSSGSRSARRRRARRRPRPPARPTRRRRPSRRRRPTPQPARRPTPACAAS
jgi:protein phosphatase